MMGAKHSFGLRSTSQTLPPWNTMLCVTISEGVCGGRALTVPKEGRLYSLSNGLSLFPDRYPCRARSRAGFTRMRDESGSVVSTTSCPLIDPLSDEKGADQSGRAADTSASMNDTGE